MTTFDHGLSPRLGQRVNDTNGVQLVTTITLPEAAYRGQLVYLLDIDEFRVFDGDAWQIPAPPQLGGYQTFVGPDQPVADNPGDTWMRTTDYTMWVWDGTIWREVQDPTANQALSEASAASAKATENSGRLDTLKTEVDGKTVTYYQSTTPAGASKNDLWFNTATNRLFYHDGSADPWKEVVDQELIDATGRLNTLEPQVDQKITTYYVNLWAERPLNLTSADTGDMLFVAEYDNEPYMWRNGTWQSVRDGSIADASASAASAQTAANNAMTAAQTAQATADNAIRTYYQAEPPWADNSTQPAEVLGDLWYDTDTDIAYRWNGTTWQAIQDDAIASAMAAAQNAQTTADGKITSWYQPAQPWPNGDAAHANDAGDLWFDTDDNNKPYYYTGSAWVVVRDGEIANAEARSKGYTDTQIDLVETNLANLQNDVDGKTTTFYGEFPGDHGYRWVGTPHNSESTKIDVNGEVARNRVLNPAIKHTTGTVEIARNLTTNPQMETTSGTTEVGRNLPKNPSLETATASSEVAQNLARNPSVETALSYWSNATGATLTRVADSTMHGAYVVNHEATTNGFSYGYVHATANEVPARPGETFSASASVKCHAGAVRPMKVNIVWRNSAGAATGSAEGAAVTPSALGIVVRVNVSGTAPADTTYMQVQVRTDNAVVGDHYRWDGMLITKSAIQPAYFDGDTPDTTDVQYAWTGTAHVSTSTKTSVGMAPVETARNLSVDPRAKAFGNAAGTFQNTRWGMYTTYTLGTGGGDPYGIGTFARGTVDTSQGAMGFHVAGNPDGTSPSGALAMSGGTHLHVSALIRCSEAIAWGWAIDFFDAAGNVLNQSGSANFDLAANTWQEVKGTWELPAGTTQVTLYCVEKGATSLAVGTTFDGTGLLIANTNSATPPAYFDGDYVDTVETEYAWVGTAHASASTKTATGMVEIARNRVPNPSMELLTGTTREITRNIVLNPSAEGGVTAIKAIGSAGGGPVHDTTTAQVGAGSAKIEVTTTTANSSKGINWYLDTAQYAKAGDRIQWSVWVRHNRTVSAYCYAEGAVVSTGGYAGWNAGGTKEVPANTWTKLTSEVITVEADREMRSVGFLIASQASPDVIWGDACLVVRNNTLPPNYFDGSTPATSDITYSWTGTANASASIRTGKLVSTYDSNVPSVYSTAWSVHGGGSLEMYPNGNTTDSYAHVNGDLGAMRLGMVAGRTYRISATINTPVALSGTLNGRAQKIVCFHTNGANGYPTVQSVAGPTTGTARLTVDFAIPADATEAFVRLYHGGAGPEVVRWDAVSVIDITDQEPPGGTDYFDGNTRMTGDYTYAWTGTPNYSPSVRKAPGVEYWVGRLGIEAPHSSVERSWTGEKSLRARFRDSGAGTYFHEFDASGILKGKTATASAWVWVPTGMTVRAYLYSAGTGFISGTSAVGNDAWQRVSVTGTFDSGSRQNFYVRRENATGAAGDVWVDGVVLTDGDYLFDYFDGSTTNTTDFTYSWSGTPHGSAASKTANKPATYYGGSSVRWTPYQADRGGQKVTRVQMFATNTTGGGYVTQQNVDSQPITAGKWFGASCRVYGSGDWAKVVIQWYDASTAVIGSASGVWTPVTSAGVRITAEGLAPTNTVKARLVAYFAGSADGVAPASANAVFDLDEWMTLVGPSQEVVKSHNYFDGGTAAEGDYTYAWTGTAHASASIKTAPKATGWDPAGTDALGWQTTADAEGGYAFAVRGSTTWSYARFTPVVGIEPGEQFTLLFRVKTPDTTIRVVDRSAAYSGNTVTDYPVTPNVWTEIRAVRTRQGTYPFYLDIGSESTSQVPAWEPYYVRQVLVVKGDYQGPYFDGDLMDWSPNDMWYDTTNNRLYVNDNGAQTEITDSRIVDSVGRLNTLEPQVDAKISSYYSTWANRPLNLVSPANDGDILYVSDQKNESYIWRNGTWTSVRDTDIEEALTTAVEKSKTYLVATWVDRPQDLTSPTDDGDLLVVTDQPGKQWVWRNFAWQPVTTDGVAPTTSPAATLVGGVGALHARWPAVTNADPVTYEVHLSTDSAFTPSDATKVGETTATSMTIKAMPNGDPLEYNYYSASADTVSGQLHVEYTVKVWAKDEDGKAPAAGTGSTTTLYEVTNTEISSNYAYFGSVSFSQMVGGTINANALLAGNFSTAESGQRVVIGPGGIELFSPDDTPLVKLPTAAGEPAEFRGNAYVSTLEVDSFTTLKQSELAEGSKMTIQAGVQAPTGPPTAWLDHSVSQYTNDGYWDDRRGWAKDTSGYRYTYNEATNRVEQWSSSTRSRTMNVAMPNWVTRGFVTWGGGYPWLSCWDTEIGGWVICRLNVSTLALEWEYLNEAAWLETWRYVAIDWSDASNSLVMAHARKSNEKLYMCKLLFASGQSSYVRDGSYTISDGVYGVHTPGIYYGSADFGATRWVTADRANNNPFRVYDTAGVRMTNEEWDADMSVWKVGFFYDSSLGKFIGMDGAGREITYEKSNHYWTTSSDGSKQWQFAYTWYDSTRQTTRSPFATINMRKRWRVRLSGSNTPSGGPIGAKFYGRNYSTSTALGNSYLMATHQSSAPTAILTNTTFSGTLDPTSNSYGSGTPAKIVSASGSGTRADGTPKFEVTGSGVGRFDGLLPPGSIQLYAGSSAPPGWLICDGGEYNRTTYADLYNVIGTTFGTAASTSNFKLPDLRDRAAVGVSSSKGRGSTGGSDSVNIAVTNLPAHEHGINHNHGTTSTDGSHTHTYTWRENASGGGPQSNIMAAGNTAGTVVTKRSAGTGESTHWHNVPAFEGTSGPGGAQGLNGTALSVQNPYIALNYIIKT